LRELPLATVSSGGSHNTRLHRRRRICSSWLRAPRTQSAESTPTHTHSSVAKHLEKKQKKQKKKQIVIDDGGVGGVTGHGARMLVCSYDVNPTCVGAAWETAGDQTAKKEKKGRV